MLVVDGPTTAPPPRRCSDEVPVDHDADSDSANDEPLAAQHDEEEALSLTPERCADGDGYRCASGRDDFKSADYNNDEAPSSLPVLPVEYEVVSRTRRYSVGTLPDCSLNVCHRPVPRHTIIPCCCGLHGDCDGQVSLR